MPIALAGAVASAATLRTSARILARAAVVRFVKNDERADAGDSVRIIAQGQRGKVAGGSGNPSDWRGKAYRSE